MTEIVQLGVALCARATQLQECALLLDSQIESGLSLDTRKDYLQYIDDYERQLHAYASQTKAHRNALSPVNRLSPELLTSVFRYASDDPWSTSDLSRHLVITHVCRRWRSVALDDPYLWTTIKCPMSAQLDVLPLYLQRAKNRQCTARISFFKEKTNSWSDQTDHTSLNVAIATQIATTLKTHAHRLKGLTLRFRTEHIDAVRSILSVAFTNLAQFHLEYLRESHYQAPTTYTLADNEFTASLVELTDMTFINVQTERFAVLPMTKLRGLSLRGDGQIPMDAVARICSRNPSLFSLALGIQLVSPSSSSKLYQWYTPKLRVLTIQDAAVEFLPAIYRRVDFVHVTRMSLKSDRRWRLAFEDVSQVFAHIYKADYAHISCCANSCDISISAQKYWRAVDAELLNMTRPALLQQLAFDFRFFRYLTSLTINPCIIPSLVDVVDSAPLRLVTSLDILFDHCHRTSRSNQGRHPTRDAKAQRFDSGHVALGLKRLRCPALVELALIAECDELTVDDEVLLSLVDAIDTGDTKLKKLRVSGLLCPALKASRALDPRAEEVDCSWDSEDEEV